MGQLSNALVRPARDYVAMPGELDKPTERRVQRWLLEQRYDQLRRELQREMAEKPAAREGSAE